MDDALNTWETEVINLFKGTGAYDSNDLTDNVSAANMHVKLREDIRTYYGAQVPAIGVMSFNVTEVSDNRDEIQMLAQVVHTGADLPTLDNTVKIIIWKMWKLLKAQRATGNNECLNGNAEDIENMSADIIHGGIPETDSDDFSALFALGELRFTIISKGEE